jgi:predicted nucleic acid-binding protein
MIFIDTDIFVIGELFQEDERYRVNKRFLELEDDKSTSIYNLLELCGLASFTLNTAELTNLFANFHRQHSLKILYPKILKPSPEEMIRNHVSRIFEKICARMNYSDAQIILVAEEYDCSDFVTWNVKHFEGRTHLNVTTPKEYLQTSARHTK